VFGVLDDQARGRTRHGEVNHCRGDARSITRVQFADISTTRQRPAEDFSRSLARAGSGSWRVPLASGCSRGVAPTAVRRAASQPQRRGEEFDQATFSGDYETACAPSRAETAGPGRLAQLALADDVPEVTAAIPGARNEQQVASNCGAADIPPLTPEQMQRVRDVYDRYFRAAIHPRW
jgi:aryl-alcohol dehydrogenase-like predicted oxidoreductase